jgi:deoxyribodipyrimidine photo-lyase
LVWESKGEAINQDLRYPQTGVLQHDTLPVAVQEGRTGIEGIDRGIKELLSTGYVHNHQRMYIASVVCNIARCRWQTAARWMYYHLLDGDWASNMLSWQWVAGTNSSKLYFANQENINTYCGTDQRATFLDVAYEELPELKVPAVLEQTGVPDLSVRLPESSTIELDPQLPVLIYNSYNLDPHWRSVQPANRVLLLEPEHFNRHPVSDKVIRHILALASRIDGIKIHTGDFNSLHSKSSGQPFFFRQHPFTSHYSGTMDEREWLTDIKGYFPSFFSFWKKAEKQLFAD